MLAILCKELIPQASFPWRGLRNAPEPPEELQTLQTTRAAAESMTACCMEGFDGRVPCNPGGDSLSQCFPWGNIVCAKCLLCAENLSPAPEVQGILFGHRAMF